MAEYSHQFGTWNSDGRTFATRSVLQKKVVLTGRFKLMSSVLLCGTLKVPTHRLRSFAIIGASLRLTVHLFLQEIREAPQMLLRPGRNEQKTALLTSHFSYDRPMSEILTAMPEFSF